MKEKYLQQRINDYLGWMKLKYIHLTTFLSKRIISPYCHKSFIRNITIPGNKGLPDLIVWTKDRPLIIELKAKKGRLTDKQKEYIEYLNKKDYNVHVIKKFEDFEKLLNKRR